VAYLEGGGGNLVVFCISMHLKSGLIRGVAFGGSGLIIGRLLYLIYALIFSTTYIQEKLMPSKRMVRNRE
jgi:hypothetical protein